MKITSVIALLIALVAMFHFGTCNGRKAALAEITLEPDTVWLTKNIEVIPSDLPAPDPVTVVRKILVPDEASKDSLATLLFNEREYFARIVDQKDRAIAALESSQPGIGGVGVAVESDPEIEPVTEVDESQLVNYFSIEQTDSMGTTLRGIIPVLGTLYDPAPPMFELTYPAYFKNFVHPDQERPRRRAFGLSAAVRQDWGNLEELSAGARLHYRRGALFIGGGIWSPASDPLRPSGVEGFAGLEIEWAKKK